MSLGSITVVITEAKLQWVTVYQQRAEKTSINYVTLSAVFD